MFHCATVREQHTAVGVNIEKRMSWLTHLLIHTVFTSYDDRHCFQVRRMV